MTTEEIVQSFPKKEFIYVVLSLLTHRPYVECDPETFDDEAFLYDSEEAAVSHVKELIDGNHPAQAVKVLRAEMLGLFRDLFLYGVNMVVYTEKGTAYRIPLNMIIHRKEEAQMNGGQKPVENPELQLSMLYFFQELRKRRSTSENLEPVKAMEEEMLVNMVRARFLVPMKEAEVDGKKQTQIVFVKMANGFQLMPVFTDIQEYERFRGKEEFRLSVLTFEGLAGLTLPDFAKGFVVNPGGVCVPLQKEKMKELLAWGNQA